MHKQTAANTTHSFLKDLFILNVCQFICFPFISSNIHLLFFNSEANNNFNSILKSDFVLALLCKTFNIALAFIYCTPGDEMATNVSFYILILLFTISDFIFFAYKELQNKGTNTQVLTFSLVAKFFGRVLLKMIIMYFIFLFILGNLCAIAWTIWSKGVLVRAN